MTRNEYIAELCDREGAAIVCAAVLTADGAFQLALPLEFRRLCQKPAFRVALVESIARCLDELATTPMDDLTIYRSNEQNGYPST